ncbi:unnamed protein product [Schistosoma mattheei]|uniref:Uncharacterized protein n=1 Tax=Schistosoma mattheei TaxID=31246 RepID=A0AA85B027_9TREM|nr:unnamed protein product [Schistosoma mattheei]
MRLMTKFPSLSFDFESSPSSVTISVTSFTSSDAMFADAGVDTIATTHIRYCVKHNNTIALIIIMNTD